MYTVPGYSGPCLGKPPMDRRLSVRHHDLKSKEDGLWGKAGGQHSAAQTIASRTHVQVRSVFI